MFTFHLGWPQLIYLALTVFGLTVSAAKHGKPRSDENVWSSLIATALILPLLYWGGFFRV